MGRPGSEGALAYAKRPVPNGFYSGAEGLSDLLDKSVADRSHLGKPTSLRRGQLKRLVSSLAVLHPDDPVALLNQILDEPLGQPDTRTIHNAQPWMTSRMSPVMSTGRRAAAAGDPGPAWFGDLPGMFSSSSSPSKPAAIIDSRKHRVHELGPTEKRFPTLGLLQASAVQARLDRLIGRVRGGTPTGERRDDADAVMEASEFAQAWLTSAIAEAVSTAASKTPGGDMAQLEPRTEASSLVMPQPRGEVGQPKLLCVLGGPGAGKSTVAGRVAAKAGYVHLSLGSMLRAAVNSGHKDAAYIQDAMTAGKLISDSVIMSLLEQACTGRQGPYIFDGFPRNVDQALLMEKTFGRPVAVVFIDCSEDVMVERVLARATSSGRSDDNEETLTALLEQFTENIMPVMDYFEKKNVRLEPISAVQPPEKVELQVSKFFEDAVADEVAPTVESLVDGVIDGVLEGFA